MARSRITLRELANELGVSTMTVSNALNQKKGVSEALRTKICEFAKSKGYSPDPQLSQLMSHLKKTRKWVYQATIGILAFHPREVFEKDPYFQKLITPAKSHAESLGYDTEIFFMPEYKQRDLRNTLISRGIQTLMVAPLPLNIRQIRFEWDSFAVVSMTNTLTSPMTDRALPYWFQDMILTIQKLQEKGYSKVGFVIDHDQDQRGNHNWFGAFAWYQHTYSNIGKVPILLSKNPLETFASWYETEKPDAIISGMIGLGTYITEVLKLKIPKDVGYCTLGQERYRHPDYSGIEFSTDLIGMTCAQMVIKKTHQRDFGIPSHPSIMQIPSNWIDGETL